MNKKHSLQLCLIGLGWLAILWFGLEKMAVHAAAQPTGTTIPTATVMQVVITATQDTTLYEEATGAVSNGAGQYFFAGKTAGGSTRRGLLAFDLSSQLPATATVISVTLDLQMSKSNAGSEEIALHKVSTGWGEGASNAAANEGSGAPSAQNDATWIHTFFNSAQWQKPGGDFVATASASVHVAGVGAYTWGSTPQLVADVQSWLTTSTSNFGWTLIGNETSTGSTKRFGTRENTDPASRPQLTIVYTTAPVILQKSYLPLIQK